MYVLVTVYMQHMDGAGRGRYLESSLPVVRCRYLESPFNESYI